MATTNTGKALYEVCAKCDCIRGEHLDGASWACSRFVPIRPDRFEGRALPRSGGHFLGERRVYQMGAWGKWGVVTSDSRVAAYLAGFDGLRALG